MLCTSSMLSAGILLAGTVTAAPELKLPTPAEFAAGIQAKLPIPTSNGGKVVAVNAEGNTVIWTLSVPNRMVVGHSTTEIASAFKNGMCDSDFGKQFFGAGYSIRVDAGSASQPVRRGNVITSCD